MAKQRKTKNISFVLYIYKNGRQKQKVKSMNPDYVIRKLKEQ